MKSFKVQTIAAAIASSLAFGAMPNVMAATQDNGAPLSGYWNTGRLLKEYLDWRSALGWGIIGASNALITATSGASKGELTKASFQLLCGTSAAGLMATWTPTTEPTVTSHLKAVVKAATVVGASSACGWVSEWAFFAIDSRIRDAQNAINGLTPYKSGVVQSAINDANNNMLAFQATLQNFQEADQKADKNLDAYLELGCTKNNRSSGLCKAYWDEYQLATVAKSHRMQYLNDHGANLSKDMGIINSTVNS